MSRHHVYQWDVLCTEYHDITIVYCSLAVRSAHYCTTISLYTALSTSVCNCLVSLYAARDCVSAAERIA
eukprot:19257-Heterococcus_DN1.PRE.1